MKLISLFVDLIKLMFLRPSAITKSLYHLVRKEKFRRLCINNFNLAQGLPMVDMNDLFEVAEGEVGPIALLNGSSKPTDFFVLKKLAERFGGQCQYLEIGSWRGESLAVVVKDCEKCTSVSLGEADIRKLGLGDRFIKMQNFFSKDLKNVLYIEANSLKFDFSSLNQKYDLIFVDGDHSYEGVKSDTQKVFSLLKNEQSIIVWHDYAMEYEVVNWEVFLGIMEGAPKEARSKIYHIANSLCAIYTNEKLKTYPSVFPNYPTKKFTVRIKAEKINSNLD
jgi:hypothetical protein